MEPVLVATIVILAITVLVLAGLVLRRPAGSPEEPGPGTDLVPVPSTAELERSARDGLKVVPGDQGSELRLGDVPLMSLERWTPSGADELQPIEGTFAAWIGTMLDNPRVLEYIAGERWVLAKVPQAIRDGGTWMNSGGIPKAIALEPGSNVFAAIPQLVRGGAVMGTAAALGPAIIGGVAVAYAHHEITAGIERIEQRISGLERRMQAADLGIIDGSRRLLQEMEEWGPPHRWPEQLRWELAVRRAALDPVCFTQRANVDRLLSAMLKDGKKFVGLKEEERAELERSLEALSLATMTRAQIGFATTMVLLDSADAPFGLARLSRLTEEFVGELSAIVDDLQAALDGERPGRIGSWKNRLTLAHSRRHVPTEQVVTQLIEDLAAVAAAVDGASGSTLVLSVEDGELHVATPQFALGPGNPTEDATTLANALTTESTRVASGSAAPNEESH